MELNGRLEMYKDRYYFEQNRKHRIHSDASIIVALLVPLIGAANFFVYRAMYVLGTLNLPQVLFLVSLIGFLISIGFAVFYVAKAWYKYPYGYMPKTQKIEKYYDDIIASHVGQIKEVNDKFKTFLVKKYCETIDRNIDNNDAKLERLRLAKKSVIISFICMTLCTMFYVWFLIATSS